VEDGLANKSKLFAASVRPEISPNRTSDAFCKPDARLLYTGGK
jgi:hypothetical protein